MMEEKSRDDGTPTASNTESPLSEPPPSRRRAGQKRKLSSLGVANSSSTPSKRTTREKPSLSLPPIHNGPLTRARQGPNNHATDVSASSVKTASTKAHSEAAPGGEVAAAEELNKVGELEALEASFEAEYEAIRSRGANAHVVPNHCGWFSWTKVHPIEEHTMPYFFNGKSKTRNPDMYMEIRNWIMKKFHADPNTQIELKDLSELEVGDLDDRQEVMEFLDHWGLINFHPFPFTGFAASNADDGADKMDALVDKLYHFQELQSCPSIITKSNVTTPTVPSGLFPESMIAEELARPEGPEVEYHCNSCSADCSRKRYHCQKQADFDLCTECFSNGKFDSDMSSTDFILMEPAEAPGFSGGKWTDQETLLLLEALELYKENWNEIAEHVATKTKAQCILHFVQMPIEDTFLDCDDGVDPSFRETGDPPSNENDTSAAQDVTEATENKIGDSECEPLTSPVETSRKEDPGNVKVGPENSKLEDASDVEVSHEKSKPEDVCHEDGENFALKALREAFEAIGYIPTPENPISFADVGNPVMALASFLAQLVGSDVACASAHSSIKSINGNASGIELAIRHCFLLEDPPNDKEEVATLGSVVAGMDDMEAGKDENQQHTTQTEDNPSSVLNDRALLSDYKNNDGKMLGSAPEEKIMEILDTGKSSEKSDAAIEQDVIAQQEVASSSNDPRNLELPKDDGSGSLQESDDLPSKMEVPATSVEDGEPCQQTEAPKDLDMSDPQPSENKELKEGLKSNSVEKVSNSKDDSKDSDMVLDSLTTGKNEPQKSVLASLAGESSQPTEAPKEVDSVSVSEPEKNEPMQRDASNFMVENGESTGPTDSPPPGKNESLKPVSDSVVGRKPGEDKSKDCKEENHLSKGKKIDKIHRLKRAAVTALSAATVKAKLLADQEEHQIRQLAVLLIQNQLHKLETKLGFINEMDNVILRVREQLDRAKQRLYQERAQIIATRLGYPGSSSRGTKPQSLPTNRVAMNLANSVPRPPLSMTSQRPPISRPMGAVAPTSNSFTSTTVAGSPFRPSSQDNLSSVGTK